MQSETFNLEVYIKMIMLISWSISWNKNLVVKMFIKV
jgi:hypothetical protein